jgi:hypothetical protein
LDGYTWVLAEVFVGEPDYDVDEYGFVGVEEAEYVRLRLIEQAAREVVEHHRWPIGHDGIGHSTSPYIEALRSSLGEKVDG